MKKIFVHLLVRIIIPKVVVLIYGPDLLVVRLSMTARPELMQKAISRTHAVGDRAAVTEKAEVYLHKSRPIYVALMFLKTVNRQHGRVAVTASVVSAEKMFQTEASPKPAVQR